MMRDNLDEAEEKAATFATLVRGVVLVSAALAAAAVLLALTARADIVADTQAAIDTANARFMAAKCGGSPLTQEQRDRALGLVLRAGWQLVVHQKQAALEAQVRSDGVERVCAALRDAYSGAR